MFSIEKNNKFIPELIVEYLQQNGMKFIVSLPDGEDITIDSIIEYCDKIGKENGLTNIDFERLIYEALSIGYDKRYLSEEKNERILNDNIYQIYGLTPKEIVIIDSFFQQL